MRLEDPVARAYQVIREALDKFEGQMIGRELAAKMSLEVNQVLQTQAQALGLRGPDELKFDFKSVTQDQLSVVPGDRYTAFVLFNATNGIRTDFHRDDCPLELDINGTKVRYDDSTGDLIVVPVVPIDHIEINFIIEGDQNENKSDGAGSPPG